MRSIACLLATCLFLVATSCTAPASTEARVTGAPAPGLMQLREATVAGIEGEPVRLAGGVWEGEPDVNGGASRPRVELVEGLLATGDLDGEGADEVVVLLASSAGGTGSRLHVAAFGSGAGDGGAVQRGLATLGDRPQVRSLAVVHGSVEIEAILHGPDDPACCPTRKTRLAYALDGGVLREVGRVDRGVISYGDLDGSSWRMSEIDRGEPAVPGSTVTLSFDGGAASGSTGCNNFRGSYEGLEKTGQGLKLGRFSSTERACLGAGLMAQESRYLRALSGTFQFSYAAGRLVLTYALEGGATGTLFFEPDA